MHDYVYTPCDDCGADSSWLVETVPDATPYHFCKQCKPSYREPDWAVAVHQESPERACSIWSGFRWQGQWESASAYPHDMLPTVLPEWEASLAMLYRCGICGFKAGVEHKKKL